MIEYSVIVGDRQSGKTHTMMHEIHDWIVAGRGAEILIVFPAVNWVHWWTRQWQSLFPYVPMPEYTTINNTLNIRGKRFSKAYVEDVDQIDGGIYNPRLDDVLISLLSPFDDEEIVFTYTPLSLNQRSHNATYTKWDVIKKMRKSSE